MGRPRRELAARCALALVLTVGVADCGLVRDRGSSSPGAVPVGTAEPGPVGKSADPSAVLLRQSRAARADRDFAAAVAAIERALRIEPNDAELWLEFGRVRLAQGDFEQAEMLARKAVSLAGDDRALREASARLIADAHREQSRADFAADMESELH